MASTWNLDEALADEVNEDGSICKKLVRMIEKDQCTLPFIARYRKQETNNMSLEKLRKVFETLEHLKEVQKKIATSITKLEKSCVDQKISEDVKISLKNARHQEEIEFIMAPYKSAGGKKTLAGRAIELGLHDFADRILRGETVNMDIKVNNDKGKMMSTKEIVEGIQHVIADRISKNAEVLGYVKKMFKNTDVRIVTHQKSVATSKAATAKAAATKAKMVTKPVKPKRDDSHKYEQYFDFNVSARSIRPHQVLAINRAESQKYISVKVTVPDRFETLYQQYCERQWRCITPDHRGLFQLSAADAYKRLLLPMLTRQCRSQLTLSAELSSVDTFGDNLKGLLLQPPCRGQIILGVDPGFTNGCKLATISQTGEVLETLTTFLHSHNRRDNEKQKLVKLVTKHKCSVIALGNGTACRETETIISDCITQNLFSPHKVKYCIVNEDGSSVYSVSEIGEKELPNLDQNHRSAVSIARRLQDPLVELVKIEPQHIGVGMYQHDIAESKLKARLDSILTECVSFVGVEINHVNQHVLSHVSGLNKTKAAAILKERDRLGGTFVCREQLLQVKGLGSKCFEQCAGFIHVKPPDLPTKNRYTPQKGRKKAKLEFESNPLDQTMIHPSMYATAERLMSKIGIDEEEIGTDETIETVQRWKGGSDLETVALTLETNSGTLSVILEAFQQKLNHDLRDHMTKPLFHTGKTSAESLRTGDVLTGVVRNVTDFGAFVDIGVHKNGLVHKSKMRSHKLTVGNQLEVRIVELDLNRGRISLELLKVL